MYLFKVQTFELKIKEARRNCPFLYCGHICLILCYETVLSGILKLVFFKYVRIN